MRRSITMNAYLMALALAVLLMNMTPVAADVSTTCKTMIEQKSKEPSVTSMAGYTLEKCIAAAATAYTTCVQQLCSQLSAKDKRRDKSCQ